MNNYYGLLILPDIQTVGDVHADEWTDRELRQQLRVGNDELVRRDVDRTGDTIIVSAYLNSTTAGKPSRCEGFDLYGERFYGPALVISSENNHRCPVLDPHDINRVIHFFRLDHNPSNRVRVNGSTTNIL